MRGREYLCGEEDTAAFKGLLEIRFTKNIDVKDIVVLYETVDVFPETFDISVTKLAACRERSFSRKRDLLEFKECATSFNDRIGETLQECSSVVAIKENMRSAFI